jgi:hypothetical protein
MILPFYRIKSTKMKKILYSFLLLTFVSVIILISCSKSDSDNANTTLKVKLTDRPALYDEVNVDIQEVRVNFRNDSSGWISLNTNAGIYDLLTLQNGIDTVLATGVIPSNSVKEIRFVLGANNTVKVGGIVFPLAIPSGSQSGLKIKVDKSLVGTVDSLLIDFDAALSIHQTGTGDYQLKPVLRIK